MKKQYCVNCHFLTEEEELLKTTESVEEEHRKFLKRGEFVLVKDWNLKCDQGAWDQKYDSEKFDPNEELNLIDRSGLCFFWNYNEKISLSAAKRFEERQYRNTQINKTNKYM